MNIAHTVSRVLSALKHPESLTSGKGSLILAALVGVVLELREHYLDGSSQLGKNLDELFLAIERGARTDPALADLGAMQKMELWTTVRMLRAERKKKGTDGQAETKSKEA